MYPDILIQVNRCHCPALLRHCNTTVSTWGLHKYFQYWKQIIITHGKKSPVIFAIIATYVVTKTEFQPDSARKRSHNLHEPYQLPNVQEITPDDGHRRCPKHVEFYDDINFGYLMHLVGCFIRSLSRCTDTWT